MEDERAFMEIATDHMTSATIFTEVTLAHTDDAIDHTEDVIACTEVATFYIEVVTDHMVLCSPPGT